MAKSLHTNRKVFAKLPLAQESNDAVNYASRISLLNQAFHDLNHAVFDDLTFSEFSNCFEQKVVHHHESYFRDLHTQFTNTTASAIQVEGSNYFQFSVGLKIFVQKEFHLILYELQITKKLQSLQSVLSRLRAEKIDSKDQNISKLQMRLERMRRELSNADR